MNGMLTTQLRYKWGVGDKNRDNHLHHAEDAIILAFSTQSMVKKLSDVSAKREGFIYKSKEQKAKSLRFITPLDDFGKKVKESLNKIFVSHMPRRKVSGAAHSQLPYRKKCHINKTKEEQLDRNSIKISKGVLTRGGICENENMPRVDVFVQKNTKKYFLIPLYVSDFVKDKLPNKAIVANNNPWVEMDDEYDFCFSIYKNDMILIKHKNKDETIGYFAGLDASTAYVTIKEHRNIDSGSFKYVKDKKTGKQNSLHRFGIKQGVEKFSKYQVNPLGDYVEVKNEKRQMTIKYDWDKKIKKRAIKRAERKKNQN
jgi:CRISPR-associated endonuclease Csn1